MRILFNAPLGFGQFDNYDWLPVELVEPIHSESALDGAAIVRVKFPSGMEMDAFTDELVIRE